MGATAPLSRRRALQLGGLGLAGVVAGGIGIAATTTSRISAVPGEALTAPTTLASTGGTLDVTLTAAVDRTSVAGRSATTLRYNGGLPGPTLHLSPGDHLGVDLVNSLAAPTNLHTHGLQVSPQGNGDNPFLVIEPGQTAHYDYLVPADHPAGTFWYHPHLHGRTAEQVFAGLYGAIVIHEADPPPVTGDRVLVVSDIDLDASGSVTSTSAAQRMQGRQGDLVLVNGQLTPELTVAPGSRERWRIVNACVSRYLRLRLDGQRLELLGVDLLHGGPPTIVEEVLLAPGNRADLLVTTTTGTAVLQSVPYDRGASMGMGGMRRGASPAGVDLLTLTVAGAPAPPAPRVAPRPRMQDLRSSTGVRERRLMLAMGMGMAGPGSFTIDGRSFDAARTDSVVPAGAVEEWVLINTSPMDHPFHLHVWPMQLISLGGRDLADPTWRDVVNVEAHSRTIVRIRFGPHTGRSVYHCHILDHEDLGMMGVVAVGQV